MMDLNKVDSIGGLTQALKRESSRHESKHGLDDWACALLDVARAIDDRFDSDMLIGGGESNEDLGATVERQKATIDRLMGLCASRENEAQSVVNGVLSLVHRKFDYDRDAHELIRGTLRVGALPRCPKCLGKRTLKPMFYVYECDHCHGTGCDVNEPIAVIQAQQKLLDAQRVALTKSRGLLFQYAMSLEEREGYSVEQFYKD